MIARNLLIYLSLKYDGDWKSIYYAIERQEDVDPDEVDAVALHAEKELQSQAHKAGAIMTCIDADYPDWLKQHACPPFVLYLKDGECTTVPFKGLEDAHV